MTIKELKTLYREELTTYSKKEADRLFFIFLEEFSGNTLLQLLNNPEKEIETPQQDKLLGAFHQLKDGIPYQHILGYTHFSGLKLKVSGSALIPRPETEELAYLIKEKVTNIPGLRILDIGTGTGCLALACAYHFKHSVVEAWDISEDALRLAMANANTNQLQVSFKKVDFLNYKGLQDEPWDLIVSNPPYIGSSEEADMDELVLKNEPHIALFVPDNNPLVFYSGIAEYAAKNLKEGGQIFVEINQKLGKESLNVFTDRGFSAELLKDLSSNNRFVIARK